jgi:hypothetical protein
MAPPQRSTRSPGSERPRRRLDVESVATNVHSSASIGDACSDGLPQCEQDTRIGLRFHPLPRSNDGNITVPRLGDSDDVDRRLGNG